jgi:exopolysaccharide/PEP-CTERM locus tyrosine autokinase
MNQHSPLLASGSLLERAAELYGFGTPAAAPIATPEPRSEPEVARPQPEVETEKPRPQPKARALVPAPPPQGGRQGAIARDSLREAGFIEPESPVGGLAEEFRIVKRQLLLGVAGKTGIAPDKRRTILLCSARPDEGKTFCAVNLALSLAAEKEVEVLLVDADFGKPEIVSILGLDDGPGLVDALADPAVDAEALVVRTDVGGLSVLPAGRPVANVPELLAAERSAEVLDALTRNHPKRILLFDSSPALMASAATMLASRVGQLLMVVRADQTTEADLREALGLLSGCEQVSLLLNGAGFAATGRRFGAYYGYGQ